MEDESAGKLLIQKPANEGKLNKRQAQALQKLSHKVSQASIKHMLSLMEHVTLSKALKDAKLNGL